MKKNIPTKHFNIDFASKSRGKYTLRTLAKKRDNKTFPRLSTKKTGRVLKDVCGNAVPLRGELKDTWDGDTSMLCTWGQFTNATDMVLVSGLNSCAAIIIAEWTGGCFDHYFACHLGYQSTTGDNSWNQSIETTVEQTETRTEDWNTDGLYYAVVLVGQNSKGSINAKDDDFKTVISAMEPNVQCLVLLRPSDKSIVDHDIEASNKAFLGLRKNGELVVGNERGELDKKIEGKVPRHFTPELVEWGFTTTTTQLT